MMMWCLGWKGVVGNSKANEKTTRIVAVLNIVCGTLGLLAISLGVRKLFLGGGNVTRTRHTWAGGDPKPYVVKYEFQNSLMYCTVSPPPEAQNWTFARPRMGHAFCLFSQLILLVVLGGEVGELERRGMGGPPTGQ